MKPIDEVEAYFRRQGCFILVDVRAKKLKFYGFKQPVINRLMDQLRGRTHEMVNFLIARARAKG